MTSLFLTVFGTKRDVMWGVLNALIICIPVYLINMGEYHQYTAVAKQAVYAFFIGSSMVRIARKTAQWVINHHILHDRTAVWFGILAAWFVNLVLNIILHSVGGTPDPVNTVTVVSALTFIGLIFTGYIETHYLRKEKQESRV